MFYTKNVYDVTSFNYSSGSTSYSVIVGVDVSGCGIRDFNPLIASRISLIFLSIAVCFSVSEIDDVFEILYCKQICYEITFDFMVTAFELFYFQFTRSPFILKFFNFCLCQVYFGVKVRHVT